MKQGYPDTGQEAAQGRGPHGKKHQLGVPCEFPGSHTPEEFRGHSVGRGTTSRVWLRTEEAEFKTGWILQSSIPERGRPHRGRELWGAAEGFSPVFMHCLVHTCQESSRTYRRDMGSPLEFTHASHRLWSHRPEMEILCNTRDVG